jgi:glycosyltransferase involved in cell wall biosynthesis
MRLAIAHEWLAVRAGSEKTFEAMAQTFPDADLFALTRDPSLAFDFGTRRVNTTVLDRSDFLRRRRDLTLPLMPLAWSLLGSADRYDRVITSSHACVKAFPPARVAEHFCYVHAPMRYAWDRAIDARGRGSNLTGLALEALRRWDRRAAATVDYFAANSSAVRDRIDHCYGRDARVLFPPVDTAFFTPAPCDVPRRGALAVSRFIPYKRLDLAIDACARIRLPITVAGSGPEEAALRARAACTHTPVAFELSPSDERLRELYRSAEVLIFPAEEDFGIVPVEAQACGTPVVAFGAGGACDTVVHGITGLLVGSQDAELFADAVYDIRASSIGVLDCRRNAARFSRSRFQSELRSWVGGE